MIISEIIRIIEKQLNLSQNTINSETTFEEISSWDSLNHAVIINLIEQHFDINFELDEMLDFENIEDIRKAVAQKIN